jgi:hypothetical protein
MVEIGKYLPNLTYLHIGHCRYVSYFARIGVNCPRLRHLRMPGLPNLPAEEIKQLFTQGLSLRYINAHESKINDRALVALSETSPLLTEIDVSDCKLTDASISALFRNCWYIQVADLTGTLR